MRPIDADDLLEIIEKYCGGYSCHDNESFDKRAVRMAIRSAPTLTPQNEWVSVEERLPELPDASWCSRSIIVCDKDGNVAPLLWARAQVRGKTVERWKCHWGRIYDGTETAHWMPLPEPPDRRPPEREES